MSKPEGGRMLEEFLAANRATIIERSRERVAARVSPKASESNLTHGIPVFLDQLALALRQDRSTEVVDHDQLNKTAAFHGGDLLKLGLTIAQVVHGYGDICQVVTQLAVEQHAPISAEDFSTLNLCLDNAIANAVTEYTRQREQEIAEEGTERLGALAHELRNVLSTATLSFELISSGRVAAGGSTSLVLGRSLLALTDLVDRSLVDVRLDAGVQRQQLIPVDQFVEELEIGAMLQAHAKGIRFTLSSTPHHGLIEGDRQILLAAVSNLLQNAFKFSPKDGHVSLTTRVTEERVQFDVEDECGGLPAGKKEELFLPFQQRSADRSGLGLGLSICLKAARAHHGEIHIRDLPGKGCIFSFDLPRKG